MSFSLSSEAFRHGDRIPVRYTCDGDNLSPPLAWSGAPAATRTFALIMDDPDAPSGTFTHWLLGNLAGSRSALASGEAPEEAVSGRNDFASSAYGGPCPPHGHGPHRYRFHLHALSRSLDLARGYSAADFSRAIDACRLATAVLEATYERPPAGRSGRRR